MTVPLRGNLLTQLARASTSTPTSIATFTSSAVSLESKAKRKSRLIRKSHIERKASLVRETVATRPNSLSGYAPGQEQVWEGSLLKSVLLNREQVWGTTVRIEKAVEEVQEDGQLAPLPPYTPKYYNFGLSPSAVATLTNHLPKVSALRGILSPDGTPQFFDQAKRQRAEEAAAIELDKVEKLKRIIDLRNADSRGIRVENTRRIIDAFGVTSKADTGSPEVQGQLVTPLSSNASLIISRNPAAIMTSRIHSLLEHLTVQTRDIHNRRPLRSLIQQRAKVLKYLKSVDVARYEACLKAIGVSERAVEGEVIVSKKELRSTVAQGL